MKTVRIALTTPNYFKVTSWITKLRLGRKYCHACVISQDNESGLYDVSQAAHGMVHEMDLDIFKEKNNLVKVYTLTMNDVQFSRGRTWMKKQRGKGYSILGCIASTFRILRKLGLGRDGDREFICSEFAFRYLEVAFGTEIRPAGRGSDDYVCPAVLEGVLAEIEMRSPRWAQLVSDERH
jgi:hypothetical protein